MNIDLRRVLIIDDSAEDRAALRLMLASSKRHFRFDEAETGAAGLFACLESREGPPDCVLLDYHLPDYEAPELLAALGGAESPCCPVVVVTGISSSLDGASVLRLGAQDFIGKDWLNPESLARSVENAIERFAMISALRERENRLSLALSAAKLGTWDYDLVTGVSSCDLRSKELFALSPDAEYNYDTFLSSLHPGDRERAHKTVQQALQPGSGHYSNEYRTLRLREDGEPRWIRAEGRAFFNDKGQTIRFTGTLQDITEVRLATDKLRASQEIVRQRAEELSALMESAPIAIYISRDPECRVITGNRLAYELFESEPGRNLSAGPLAGVQDNTRRFFKDGRELSAKELPMQISAAEGVGILNEEIDILMPSHRTMTFLGNSSPLFDDEGRIRGSIGAFLDITERKQAGETLRRQAEALQAEIAERRKSETALEESERRLKLGIQVAGLALAEIDYPTQLNHLTAEAARMFGLGDAPITVPRQTVHATFHPDDLADLMGCITTALDPEGIGWFAMDHRVVWSDGQIRWLRVRKQIFFAGEGPARRPVHAILAALDVTVEKIATESVRQSEAFVRSVLNSLPQQVVVLDEAGVVCAVNQPWERIARDNGATPFAVSEGASYIEVCQRAAAAGDEDAPLALEAIEALLAGRREECVLEYPCHAPDGRQQWFMMHARVPDHGLSGLIISHIDITKRKRAEEALREQRARLNGIIDSAMDAIISVDQEQHILLFNPAAEKMFGYPSGQAIGTPLKRLIPERFREVHKVHLLRFGQSHTTNRAMGTLGELSALRADGEEFPVEASISQIEVDGQKLLTVILRDITERKRVEQALQSERSRFEKIVATVPGVIASFRLRPDGSTCLPYASPAIADLYGFNPEDLVDSAAPLWAIFHPDDIGKIRAGVIASARNLTPWREEYRVRHPGKGEVWVEGCSVPVPEPDGGVLWHGYLQDISERKRIEQSLRQSEERYRLIVETASEGIWLVDTEHRTTFVNPAMARMLGYAIEEMQGRLIDDFLPSEEMVDFHRQLQQRQQGNNTYYQRCLRRKDGSLCWCQVSAAPIFDAAGKFVGSLSLKTDITENKLAMEALHESETRFRSLFELSSDALMLSSEQVFFDCNEAALRIFACPTKRDFIGKSVAQFSPPTQPGGVNSTDLAKERVALALKQGSHRFDWQHCRLDGTEFPAEVLLSRIELQGKPVIQGTVRDITERKAMLKAMAQAREAAEAANLAKSAFLANMSHEIRTPMNAIMGMTELCLAANPDERQRNYLAKIQIASDALLHILDDILDFSKIEAGKLRMAEEPFYPAAVCDSVVSLLGRKALDKGLELAVEAEPRLLRMPLLGDPNRLSQVLVNLVGNAIKFSHQGRVVLRMDEESRSSDDRVTLHFAVCDEGIGISVADQARLFQPFSQADASTTRTYGGTGLGLAICRRLVELMGGRIWVDSALGRGSTFHFTACFAVSDRAPAPARQAWTMDGAALARLRGADILVVEDAELNQEVMRDFLQQAGFRVRLAVNGAEALTAVEQALPDCVLMDCQMPVMDGFEATRTLRAQERYRGLPIIALTANTMAGDREQCLAAGMDGFVAKPVDFAELYAALVQWVRPPQTPEAPNVVDTLPPRNGNTVDIMNPLPSGEGRVRGNTFDEKTDLLELASLLALTPTGSAPLASLSPEGEGLNSTALVPDCDLPELPGIDTARGLALTGGQAAFYLKLLRRFRDNRASGALEAIREALQTGDRATAIRLAHTLKGTAKTMGAGRLGELAEAVEESVQSQPEAVAGRLDALGGELDRVVAGLNRLGGLGGGRDQSTASPTDLAQRQGLARELEALLEEQDTQAVECVGLFEQALAGSAYQAEGVAIARAVARYDFKEALARLQRLAPALDPKNGS